MASPNRLFRGLKTNKNKKLFPFCKGGLTMWNSIKISFTVAFAMVFLVGSKPFEEPTKFEEKSKTVLTVETLLAVAVSLPLKIKNNPDLESPNFYNFRKYIIKSNPRVNRTLLNSIVRNILHYSEVYGLDPITVLAVMKTESGYRRWARGDDGELCLMQVNPNVWVSDESNPDRLGMVGIVKLNSKNGNYNPVAALLGISTCISAGTYILSKKRSICENWYRRRILRRRGHDSVNSCMIVRYNGIRGFKGRNYYEKVTAAVGDYYYFLKRFSLDKYKIVAYNK